MEDKRKQNIIKAVLGHRYHHRDIILPCPKEFVSRILQCVVCQFENNPLIFGGCRSSGHVICIPCHDAYLKEMDGNEDLVICPFQFGSSGFICKQTFVPINLKNGISPFWHYFLSTYEFTCSSAGYGCPYKGSGLAIIEHETLGCQYSQFRRCTWTEATTTSGSCNAEFHSAVDCLEHYVEDHKIANVSNTMLKDYLTLTDSTLQNSMCKRIFCKLCSYAPGRYCFLVVEEFNEWLRIWVTEADSKADQEKPVPVKITIPAPDFSNVDIAETNMRFQLLGKVLPFMTFHFNTKECSEGFFDVPKTFLRKFKNEAEEEKWETSILVVFGWLSKTVN